MTQSIPRTPIPPGTCRAFAVLFWKSCKCPTVELKNKLLITYLREISNNLLIKTREAPYVNRP